MEITVRLFGNLASHGPAMRRIELPQGACVADALAVVGLPGHVEAMFLLDGGPAGPDTALHEGAALDLLPIVEGG
jgi:hypothetical protein